MKIDLEQIRELLAVVSSTEVTELTLEFGDQKITIKKNPGANSPGGAPPFTAEVPAVAPAVRATEPAALPPKEEPKAAPREEHAATSNGTVPITSPMVGTFYRSPSPTAAPFVEIGDRITVGQTVCIIEAMKLMNDMPSEVSGKIVKVLVDNGTTVEYGQPLFLVDPKG